MNRRTRISVIIPVYNVESYIETCLSSILRQGIEDLEIICIDDASPDNSAEIISRMAATEPRINLVTLPQNSGVSVARNTGMDQARGTYLFIMDSDDFLELGALRKVVEFAEENDHDIVFHDAFKYEETSDREYYSYPERNKKLTDMCGHTAWWYIFKREILLNHPEVRFPRNTHPHEDSAFSFMIFSLAKSFAYLPIPVVNYRQHAAMIMNQIDGAKREQLLDSIANATTCIVRFYSSSLCDRKRRRDAYDNTIFALTKRSLWQILKRIPNDAWDVKSKVIRQNITRFVFRRKITSSNKLIIKVFKVPVFSKTLSL